MDQNKNIARIENAFALNAQYRLNATEQKIFLRLVAQINPKEEGSLVQRIPLNEFVDIVKGGKETKWGNIATVVEDTYMNMWQKGISFPSDFVWRGKKMAKGINFFQTAGMAVFDDQPCVEFTFTNAIMPFLNELNQYVRINRLEVANMTHAHAIRMYQVFKAERDRTRKQGQETKMPYRLAELKALLGIPGKYSVFKDFRRRVLDPICEDINNHSSYLTVSYDYMKDSRRVVGVVFAVTDKKLESLTSGDYVPADEEINLLSKAKLKAYETLLDFGVNPGIAYRQIIMTIEGSEARGFEDKFVEFALEYFQGTARKADSPGAFVKWWTAKKVFSNEGEFSVWDKITEKIILYRKHLEQNEPLAFDNRTVAKKMTDEEFRQWYKSQQK